MRPLALAFQELVEKAVHDVVVVEARVAHVPLADNGLFGGAGERAVRHRRDDRPLLLAQRRLRGAAHVVEHLEVRPHRHVVPRHEPQAGHIERHVVVPQAALAPRVGRRLALLHHAAGFHRHLVRENPARAVDVLDDVLRRQVPQRLVPIHGRHARREVEQARRSDQIFTRRVLREHRSHLVLLAVNPGDEQHLHGAAAIPVALLPVRADLADPGAEPLHVHRGKAGMPQRGNRRLPLCRRRASRGAHLAVRPRLLRQVVDGLVAVGDRRAEDVVVAFREEVATLVLADPRIAALDRGEDRRHVRGHAVADVPEIEVVRRLDEHDRAPCRGRVLRPIDVGGEPHAVFHRDHHAPFDDGDLLKLGFEIAAPLHVRGRERPLLRGQ